MHKEIHNKNIQDKLKIKWKEEYVTKLQESIKDMLEIDKKIREETCIKLQESIKVLLLKTKNELREENKKIIRNVKSNSKNRF